MLLRDGAFACASEGLIIRAAGRQAHAAYPEQGSNPIPLLGGLAAALPGLIGSMHPTGLLMATPVGLQAGGRNFGVSAGEGELCLTLRASLAGELQALERAMESHLAAQGGDFSWTLERQDVFPETVNHPAVFARCSALLDEMGTPCLALPQPMRWSEDFGWYLQRIPGLYLGFGAGENWPGLHTDAYYFNDALLEPCAALLLDLLRRY